MKFFKFLLIIEIQIQLYYTCPLGCSQCDNLNNCTSCQSSFSLNAQSKNCVYNQCKSQLYFQGDPSTGIGDCKAICKQDQKSDGQTNLCINVEQCSLSFSQQTGISQNDENISQIIRYDSQYFAIVYSSYITKQLQYTGRFMQMLYFQSNRQYVKYFQGFFFIFQNGNTVAKWDFQKNVTDYFPFNLKGDIDSNTQIIQLNQQYSYVITLDKKSFYFYLTLLYDQILMQFVSFSLVAQLDYQSNFKYYFFNDLIFIINSSGFTVYQINLSQNVGQELTIKPYFSQEECLNLSLTITSIIKLNNYQFLLTFASQSFYIILAQQTCSKVQIQETFAQTYDITYGIQTYHVLQLQTKLNILDNNAKLIAQVQNQNQIIDSLAIIIINYTILIAILDKQQNINFVGLNINNMQQQQLIYQFKLNNFNPIKIMIMQNQLDNNNQTTQFQIMAYSSQIQSITFKIKQGFQFDLQNQYFLKKFQRQTNDMQQSISSMDTNDNNNLATFCSANGQIITWEYSTLMQPSLVDFSFIKGYGSCNKIQFLANSVALILFQNSILAYDVIQFKTLNTWNFVNINSKMDCSQIFDDVIVQVYLDQSFYLVIQKTFSLSVFFVDLTQKQLVAKGDYTSLAQIQIVKIRSFPESFYQQSNTIIEILVYFSNFTFTIFNQQLSIIASFQNIQLSQVVDISFVTNDPSDNLYVIGGITSQKSATFKYQAFALLKNQTGVFQVIAASKINKLFPVYKSVNPANLAIGYTFKICFFQGIFTNIQDYYFNMGNQANFMQEAGGSYNVLMNTFQLIENDQFYFYGDQNGQITMDITRRQFYQNVFELNADQKQSNDFIQGVYQSLLLQRYFIIKSNILVYDLLTDQQIEQINIQSNSKILSFQILEQLQSIIFIKGNTLYFKNYQADKLYTYNNLSVITNYILDSNNVYLYGMNIAILNFDMTVKLMINSNQNIVQSCQSASLILVCKFASGLLNIFDKSNFNHVISIQQRFIDSNYFFQIDDIFQRIILYSQNIEIYSFAGFLQMYINSINSPIQDLQILKNDISVLLTIYIYVYDRVSFNYRGQIAGAGGGNVIQQQYVPPLNQILFYSSTLRFAQFFAFSLDTLQIVVQYKSTLNTPSSTVAYQYDKDQGIYILLDSGGNFYFINYQISQIQLTRLIEYDQSSNYQILGFSINYENNNVFIYSQTQVFNLQLSELNNQARKYIVNKKQLFAKIVTNSQADNSQQGFIIAGDQGLLYKYQNSAFEYFYQFDQEIQQVMYNQSLKLLIIALIDRFVLFQNFDSNTLSSLNPWSQNSQQEISVSGRFQQFICQDIYMTKDRQIYHYDFINQVTLHKITLEDSSTLILQKICSVNKPYLYLGLNNGSVLIYNKNTNTQQTINLLQNQMGASQNDVQIGKLIETSTDLWVCFASSVGVFKINLQNFQFYQIVEFSTLTTYKYIKYLNLLIFDVDEQYNRLFLSFIGEKLMRVIDLSGNIIKLVSLPGKTYNNLQINTSHLLAYTCFHIMIYDRQTLQYIQRIRRDNVYDFITDIIEIESLYILLVTYVKYELFKIQVNAAEALLMDQIQLQNPLFMGYVVNQGLQQNSIQGLLVILLSSNQIYEQRYNLVYENIRDQNKICSIDISVSAFQDLSFSMNTIKYVSFPDSSQRVMIPVNDSSLNNYWNIQLMNNDLRNIDFRSTANSLVQIYSDKNLTNSQFLSAIQIQNDSFLWYTKDELQVRDFRFVFQEKLGGIKFNNQSQSVILNNIQIQSQNISNTTLLFTNMANIVINGFHLTNLQRYQTQNNESDSLMYFCNVTKVNIYNLTLDNNNIINTPFYGLIIAKNVQNLILSNLIIQNAEISFLFNFIQVQNLTISNLQISNCFYAQTNEELYILNIIGVVNSLLSDILIKQNTNLLFIKTTNIYYDMSIQYSLYTDYLNITNLQLLQNNIQDSNSQSVVNIQSSFCHFDNMTFSKNQGNLNVIQSQYLSISNSLFEYNQCLNGGALAIISSNNQIKIIKSQFIHNQAFASGGAIYLENTNAQISMDASVIITQNKALIGGGVRLYNNKLNYPQVIQNNYKNLIFGNEADLYGKNFATFLEKAIIGVIQDEINKLNGNSNNQGNFIEYKITNFENMSLADQKQYQQILEIFHFQSGGSINLLIKLIDSEGTYLHFSLESFYYKTFPQSIIDELQIYQFKLQTQILNQDVLINGPNVITSSDYDDTNNYFAFQQIQITSIPNQTTYLIVQPNYTPSNINVLPIQVKINMRLCQIGETIKQIETHIYSCYSCPIGQYSLIDTNQDLISINNIPFPSMVLFVSEFLGNANSQVLKKFYCLISEEQIKKYGLAHIKQPSQINFFTKQLSCTKIGSQSYVSSDLTILCGDPNYNNFTYIISIPLLIIWIIYPLANASENFQCQYYRNPVKKNLNVLVKFQALQKIAQDYQSKQLNDQTQDDISMQHSNSLIQKISLINQAQRSIKIELSKFKTQTIQHNCFQLQNSIDGTYIKDEIMTKSKEKQESSDIFICERTSQYAGEVDESQGTLKFYNNNNINNLRLQQDYQTPFKIKKKLDQFQLTFRNSDLN
ncbi:hypothetical protein ABPG73_005069 [Tetrahymena malaccensis]